MVSSIIKKYGADKVYDVGVSRSVRSLDINDCLIVVVKENFFFRLRMIL